MRIGYVVAEFPSFTEHWIKAELSWLAQRGYYCHAFALTPTKPAARSEKKTEHLPFAITRNLTFPYPTGLIAELHFLSVDRNAFLSSWKLLFEHAASSWTNLLKGFRNHLIAAGLARIAQQNSISHLHAHFASFPTDIAMIMARLLNCSYSISTHARDIYVDGKQLELKLKHSNFLVTCTNYNYQHIRAQVSEHLRSKVQLVYHGIALRNFPFCPKPFANNTFTLLSVGRLIPKKGLDVAIRALHELDTAINFPIKFLIVGDGSERKSLEQAANKLTHISVHFLGELLHDEVRKIYPTAHVFVLPCRIHQNGDRDGLPNVLLEAAASGTAIITTGISGIPEFVSHEETGLIFPTDDSHALAQSILRLQSDEKLHRQLTNRARALIEKDFCNTAHLKQLEQIFRTN